MRLGSSAAGSCPPATPTHSPDPFCTGYLDGNVAVGAPNDAGDGHGHIIMHSVGAVRTDVLGAIHPGQGRTDKVE